MGRLVTVPSRQSWSFMVLKEGHPDGAIGTPPFSRLMAFWLFLSPTQRGENAWNAGNIIDVPLERSAEALAAFRAFPFSGQKVGFYGISRGAEHALLLTTLMVHDAVSGMPDAVAAHSPPDVICGAFDARRWRDSGDPGWQSWDPGQRAWSWRGSSDQLLPTMPIEIECFGGPLFLSHGTADRVWSVDMARRLVARLHQRGRTPEVHYYDGQDHMPASAAENDHHVHLIAFFDRHLT